MSERVSKLCHQSGRRSSASPGKGSGRAIGRREARGARSPRRSSRRESWQSQLLKGLHGRRRRSARRQRESLNQESLERRSMMSINAIYGGGLSGSTGGNTSLIVLTAPDTNGAAADDVFITRSATGNLLIAADSSFNKTPDAGTPDDVQGRYATPDILYVTNGRKGLGPGPMNPGDHRTPVVGEPGSGYRQDIQATSVTTFTLATSVAQPSFNLDDFDRRTLLPPGSRPVPSYSTPDLDYDIRNRVLGQISYDGATWNFELNPGDSQVYFIQSSGNPNPAARPASIQLNPGQYAVSPLISRGQLVVTWSQPVASVEHSSRGQAQPPVVTIGYNEFTNDTFFDEDNLVQEGGERQSLRLLPSADSFETFQFDIRDRSRAEDTGLIIGGTLSGQIEVRTFDFRNAPTTLVFPFTTDIRSEENGIDQNAVFDLVFDDDSDPFVGRQDWLTVSGTCSRDGTIRVEFRRRYDLELPDVATSSARELVSPLLGVLPGPVALSNVAFAQYVNPSKGNDFTLFAGYDLPSQLWVDLRGGGEDGDASRINIDSPVTVAELQNDTATVSEFIRSIGGDFILRPRPVTVPSRANVTDIDLRAQIINIDARMTASPGEGDLRIAASRAFVPNLDDPSLEQGFRSELVTFNASCAIPDVVDIAVGDVRATESVLSKEGVVDVSRGRLLVTQTGSIAAAFYDASTLVYGDAGVPSVTAETEPNETRETAVNLSGSFRRSGLNTFRSTIRGSIASPGDLDFYRVPLRPFDVIQIAVDAGTLADPVVRLQDVNGAPLGYDDDSGPGSNSFLTYQNGGAATDVFVVPGSFYLSGIGSYSVTITVSGTPATPSNRILVSADTSDIVFEGVVYGIDQSYLMRSSQADKDKAPFVLKTESQSGAQTGVIRGDTLQVILANDAETPVGSPEVIASNRVDIQTAVNSLRVRASTRQNGVETSAKGPFPYELRIREEDAISIDAVAASTRSVDVAADGPMTWNATLNTWGDVTISTKNLGDSYSSFQSSTPITTLQGHIGIDASSIVLNGVVGVSKLVAGDPLRTDIDLRAAGGSVAVNSTLRSPNRIAVNQSAGAVKGAGVRGVGIIRTSDLRVTADALGRPDLGPSDVSFFMRTDVDSLTAELVNGAAVMETDEILIPALRSPGGVVALQANGVDPNPVDVNGSAITGSLIDIGNLHVSAPNGSINLEVDTGRRLLLGLPQAIADGTAPSMLAGGDVRIVSVATGFQVADAPLAGSGARVVRAATSSAIPQGVATYTAGQPGSVAGRLVSINPGSIMDIMPMGAPTLRIGDRVLVKDGLIRASGSLNTFVNGVYVVRSAGGGGARWELMRAGDSDTYAEAPHGTVVHDTNGDEYYQVRYDGYQGKASGAALAASFGKAGIGVVGSSLGFSPSTVIQSQLVTDDTSIQYLVSSSSGTNFGAGSLGKMIGLHQNGQSTLGQITSLAFSTLVEQPIVLGQELPRIASKPITLDASALARVTPDGIPARVPRQVVIDGRQITTDHRGAELFSGSTAAEVSRDNPFVLRIPATFSGLSQLGLGIAVSGVGITLGSEIARNLTPLDREGSFVRVPLDKPVDNAAFNSLGKAVVTVTFATKVDGLSFREGAADGSRVAGLNIGGFGSGAAIRVASDVQGGQGVAIERVNIGADASGLRLGNQVGVLVTDSGTASLVDGQIASSSIAGVKTEKQASVSVVGTAVGTQNLANIVGLDLDGRAASIGRVSSVLQPIAPETFVQFNRRGVIVRGGITTIQNTTVASNTFEGILVEASDASDSTTIGSATRGRTRTGQNVADSNVIQTNGTWGLRILSSALSKARVFDNVFGTDPSRSTVEANRSGNVAIDGALAGQPFVPNATSGLDANGNQHGLRGVVAAPPPSSGGPRPWQPRAS